MHNSQNDSAVLAEGPSNHLLNADCVGCHSNDTNTIKTIGSTRIPIVLTHTKPTYPANGSANSALAGGNFYWAAHEGGNAYGHNVFGINGADALATAPGTSVGDGGGGEQDCADCHATLASSKPFSGCKGCHVPRHHANDNSEVVSGSGGWYRFLGKNPAMVGDGGDYGVEGIEEEDWEQNPTSTRHNGYMGTAEVYKKTVSSRLYTKSIGQFCAGCHGNFHHDMNEDQPDAVTGSWIRHPSDVILPNRDDYAGYTVYNPLVPVAKTSLVGKKNSSQVEPGADLVTCLSCHRPHGSPYPDMLRWDYTTMVAGGGSNTTGCFVCHGSKDE